MHSVELGANWLRPVDQRGTASLRAHENGAPQIGGTSAPGPALGRRRRTMAKSGASNTPCRKVERISQ